MVRVVFQQHHIAHIGAARHAAFQQVMAEYCVFRQAVVQHGMYRRHVDQALAGESAQAEKVLVQVRSAAAVRVQTTLPGKHDVKQRAFAWLRQRRDDARLQNAVAA